MPHTILLVDDEVKLAEVLSVALERLGYRVLVVNDAAAALQTLDAEAVDLVLSDLRMPGMSGHDLLREVKRRSPHLPFVVMTAYSSFRQAVEVIKDGAFDYVSKPFEIDELETTLRNALNLYDAIRDNERLRDELQGPYRFDSLIGTSVPFRRVIEAVAEVCASTANVLITGESGTGKEVVARAIHANSPRHDQPFVAINCAAIPEGLLESELFGHVKGAFTGAVAARVGKFAQADRGTLFLDEIGDMPTAIQAKILRVVQERSFEPVGGNRSVAVNVRILAATNKDLRAAVDAGGFREDLFYRLNVFPIALPPLRARPEDVHDLACHFLDRLAGSMGKRLSGFAPEAMAAMTAYRWPGNIRELQNCIERAAIVAKGGRVEIKDLPPGMVEDRAEAAPTRRLPVDIDDELGKFERQLIVDALAQTGGVQVAAAQLLGISERSLWHRIKKHRIQIIRRVAEWGTAHI